jgi:hypothetical protein
LKKRIRPFKTEAYVRKELVFSPDLCRKFAAKPASLFLPALEGPFCQP